MKGQQCSPLLWSRFNSEKTPESSLSLILNKHVSFNVPAPCTPRDVVVKIAEHCHIPIDFLPDNLNEPTFPRGLSIFGFAGNELDRIAGNHQNMEWWVSARGLNMAIVAPRLDRSTLLATMFDEVSRLEARQRGFAFERFLKQMFAAFGLDPRGSFRLDGEQIDGSFQLESHTYLLEAKWQEGEIGNHDLQAFAGKVESKATWSKGLFISYSGFSPNGLTAFNRGKRASIICLDGKELSRIIAEDLDFADVLVQKARRAVETGRAYTPLSKLFPAMRKAPVKRLNNEQS